MESETLFFLLLSFSLPLLMILFFNKKPKPKTKTQAPSPCSYPLIGNLIALLKNHHRFLDWVSDMLSQTPSNTLQVSSFLSTSHIICTANPLNVEHLLRSNFPNYIKGDRFQSVLSELLGDGIFNADGEIWAHQRKIASHEFNTRSLKSFVSYTVRSEISHRLIPTLEKAADSEEIIDFQDVFRKFAFDNVCNLAFGEDPCCLEGADTQFIRAFDEAVEICSKRLLAPVPWIWKMKRKLNLGDERRLKIAIGKINDYATKIISARDEEAANSTGKQDLLSRFMSSNENSEMGDGEKRRKFLRDIIISFILAGKDSTSTALTWFFWLLWANPRCERLIYAEISKAAGEGELNFQYDELKEMHYLHAAISEALRLFPPVPINSRLTLKDDVLPDGNFVGAGWFADYCAYAMARMEKVWGPDCNEFRPERWLENGVFIPADQFRFPVFHAGSRLCLGKEMAYVQMKAVAASVIYGFEIEEVVGGCRHRPPPYSLALTLKMKGGLHVRLKKRTSFL
ncbi:cytochrome P450 94A1-like [Tasmannia lanceolata]|uniref:cytochrome P450 94A1-like n=1 Tax=Tasmannia lanceolata TaxID=3420 RepID=UPI0040637C96